MTRLLLASLLAAAALQEPVKPHPGEMWYPSLEADEFHEVSLKLIEVAPKAIDDFEAIINNSNAHHLHMSRLYYVLGESKVDHKRFLKSALRDLNHADAIVRVGAATFAGDVGGGSEFAAPLLMMLLHDSDNSAGCAAHIALRKIGDEGTVVAFEHMIRFGTGQQDTPERAKAVAKAFGETRDQIKARLAAAAKVAPATPK